MMNRQAQLRAGQQQVLLCRSGESLLVAMGKNPWESIELAYDFGDSILCGLHHWPPTEVLIASGLACRQAEKLSRAWERLFRPVWPTIRGPHVAYSIEGVHLASGSLSDIARTLRIDPSNTIATRRRVVGEGLVIVSER